MLRSLFVFFILTTSFQVFSQNDSIYNLEAQIVNDVFTADFYGTHDRELIYAISFEVYNANTLNLICHYIAEKNNQGFLEVKNVDTQMGRSLLGDGITRYTISALLSYENQEDMLIDAYLIKAYLSGSSGIISNILTLVINDDQCSGGDCGPVTGTHISKQEHMHRAIVKQTNSGKTLINISDGDLHADFYSFTGHSHFQNKRILKGEEISISNQGVIIIRDVVSGYLEKIKVP